MTRNGKSYRAHFARHFLKLGIICGHLNVQQELNITTARQAKVYFKLVLIIIDYQK